MRWMLALLLVAWLLVPALADAARAPSKPERRALKQTAERSHQPPSRDHAPVTVS